jgi:hypothetical protein
MSDRNPDQMEEDGGVEEMDIDPPKKKEAPAKFLKEGITAPPRRKVEGDREKNLPWVEKYRPSSLQDLIAHESIISTSAFVFMFPETKLPF